MVILFLFVEPVLPMIISFEERTGRARNRKVHVMHIVVSLVSSVGKISRTLMS